MAREERSNQQFSLAYFLGAERGTWRRVCSSGDMARACTRLRKIGRSNRVTSRRLPRLIYPPLAHCPNPRHPFHPFKLFLPGSFFIDEHRHLLRFAVAILLPPPLLLAPLMVVSSITLYLLLLNMLHMMLCEDVVDHILVITW